MTLTYDEEVCTQGEKVYSTSSVHPENLEEWVRKVARESGQRVNWRYEGNIMVVYAIGNIEAVKTAVEANLKEASRLGWLP